jgi:hypothetical protein
VWDDFGITESRMLGYWVPWCPVKTNRNNVKATVYQRDGATLIAIASWAERPVEVMLEIDWDELGIDPEAANLTAPAITGFQDAVTFEPGEKIPVDPEKGWLLIIN